MQGNVFIDTNIWVYGKFEFQDKSKSKISRELIENCGNIVISTQVVNELANVLYKNDISTDIVCEYIDILEKETSISVVSLNSIKKAIDLKIKYKYSFFDSLILSSAVENQCNTLYSEDLQHNQLIEPDLRIINPFKLND